MEAFNAAEGILYPFCQDLKKLLGRESNGYHVAFGMRAGRPDADSWKRREMVEGSIAVLSRLTALK